MGNTKNVLILSSRSGFPEGFGAAAALRNYSRGFSALEYCVTVGLIKPSEEKDSTFNLDWKGSFDRNIQYIYFPHKTKTSESKKIRIVVYAFALINLIVYLFLRIRKFEFVVIYSPDSYLETSIISFFTSFYNIKLLGIKTESSLTDPRKISNKKWQVQEARIYSRMNHMIFYTNHLAEQAKTFGYRGKVLITPIVMWNDGGNMNIGEALAEDYILYVGNLNYVDELDFLYQVMDSEEIRARAIRLILVGSSSQEPIDEIRRKLAQNYPHCSDNIIFAGRISHSEVTNKINQALMVILPRMPGEYSSAGFPIKLGDYILSGKPIVCANVGEISKYFQEEKRLFFFRSGDVSDCVSQITWIYDHPDEALDKAIAARETVLNVFDARVICRRIISEVDKYEA